MAKFTPSSREASSILAPGWAEYREVFSNGTQELLQRYVAKTYAKAFRRNTVRTMYLPVIPYITAVAAGAMELPFRVKGPPALQALFKKWRPTLSRAWKARLCSGSAFVHLASRRERLLLDHLWGDSLVITPAPDAPLEWDLVARVEVPIADQNSLSYLRDNDGNYYMVIRAGNGEYAPVEMRPGWSLIPVFPMWREDPTQLQPRCDRTVLDLHIAVGLQLSDIEFRRVFRTNQMWRKSSMVEENKTKGGSDIEASPDAVIELGETDSVGLLESGLKSVDDLAYIEAYLRLSAKLLRLPPELFLTGSRSETGAARAWDYRPLQEIQEIDRELADEWLDSFIAYIRPVLTAEGVISEQDIISVRTVPPKLPQPVDPQQEALGIKLMMELGLTSPIRELARREGVGFAAAERLVRLNLEQNKRLTRPPDKVIPEVVAPDPEIPVE